jgi:hypothetical protein
MKSPWDRCEVCGWSRDAEDDGATEGDCAHPFCARKVWQARERLRQALEPGGEELLEKVKEALQQEATATSDMTFRPVSYWDTPDTIFANIKGEQRRLMLRKVAEQGDAEELQEWLLKDKLTEEERKLIGRIHPLLMGGEYLPDYEGDEVEIARVALQSTTGDVISIRARKSGGAIHYLIVDEYESQFEYSPNRTKAPLTLGELINLIDTVKNDSMEYVGLTNTFRDMNLDAGSDPEDLVDFVTVSSPFYPQLEEHYAAEGREWLKRVNARKRGTDDAEDE